MKELKGVNSNIEIIGEFKNISTRVRCKCLIDGCEWDATPSNLLKGHRCPQCSGNKKKTQEEYVTAVANVNPNIEVIGKYKNANTKITHRCKLDGYEWDVVPNSILMGYGCPKCAGNAKRTHQDYVNDLFKTNPNIKVLGIYCGANVSIPHQCLKDGYIWNAAPSQTLSGTGCPKCAGNLLRTPEEYISEVAEINPNIEVIGEYVNARTKVTHRCKIHNIFWDAQPTSILSQGTGCPECGRIKTISATRKTNERYIQELAEINPNIIVIEEYAGANKPILHKCLIDGYEWQTAPNNVLAGHGCPKCTKHAKPTQEEYVKMVKSQNPDVEVLGQYIDSKTPIPHRCKIHNITWDACPSSILRGGGCRLCLRQRIGDSNRMTNNEYLERLYTLHPDIKALDKYIDIHTPILHKCLVDDYEWRASPGSLLHGSGCPKCAGNIKRTREQYIEELAMVNPTVELIGDYTNVKVKTQHHCLIHDIYWDAPPCTMLKGCGCPKCHFEKSGAAHKKSQERYVSEVKEINPDIEVVGEYVSANTPILHRCLFDSYEWEASPTAILNGTGCPKCNESSGERVVRQWLEKHGIEYVYQKVFEDCKDIRVMPFDFYLPEYNACVEFDGKHHFEPVFSDKYFIRTLLHDGMKNNYCRWNNIRLLRIPYFKKVDTELSNFLFI